jgi:hypothetical protein
VDPKLITLFPLSDKVIPTIAVNISSNNTMYLSQAKLSDLVTLTIIASEQLLASSLVVTIDNVASSVVLVEPNVYRAYHEMTASDPQGVVLFSVAYMDLAGNPGVFVDQTSLALQSINVTYGTFS